ncbi:hypothetical protein PAPYR_5975 [Paratrimastix pyriformis]|uniref:Protein kinase domain-containing protein n=1 Tax=Paratrimastix pyriformis TaxID=342808 RepID=A0ABQ8UJ96_9EUKA|nr:hypothetical protein PAPYR_5975 [Paratrimastix pyriformis]
MFTPAMLTAPGLAFWAFVSLVVAVSATPCYISASGVDQLPCNSPNAPCRTTSYALDTAACSHVILMTSIDIQTTIMIPSTLAELTLAGSVPGTLIRCGGNVGAIAGGLPNNLAALTLANLTFEGCRGGGALSFTTNATITATNVLVDHCVFHQCASSCDGGALSVASTTPGLVNLTLVDSWFNGSSLSGGGSPCTGGSGHGGGAVRVTNPGRVTALRTVFTHNRAGSDGGALLVTSSSGSPAAAEVRLTGCRFEDNTLNAAASNVTGGAVSMQIPGGSLTVEGCVFQGNAITTTGADQRAAFGGALHAPGLRVVTIQNSVFEDNTATSTGGDGAGGAIYLGALQDSLRLVGCDLDWNAVVGLTTATAGALFITGGEGVLVEGCLLNHNTATGQGDTHSGSLCLDGAQRVNITRTEFTFNLAQSTKASAFGGALRWHATAAGSSLRLDDVVAEGNRALACTGSEFSAQGGAIQVLMEVPSRPLIHLAACAFHQNLAFGEVSPRVYGGALAVVSSNQDDEANLCGDVTIEGSQFGWNGLEGAIGGGGAIHLGRADQVLVRDTTFDENDVEHRSWAPEDELVGLSGGAMLIGEATSVTMDAVQFVSNTIEASNLGLGGALSLSTTTAATLRGCLFDSNRISSGGILIGGGLAVFGKGDVTIEGTRFISNSIDGRTSYGGAIGTGLLGREVPPEQVALRDCWFEGNSARGDTVNGGGLCLSGQESVELTGLTFTANVVSARLAASGGGLSVTMSNEIISLARVNCSANQIVGGTTAIGAGALLEAGQLTLMETSFVGNQATASLMVAGGGLFAASTDFTMVRSYLGSNRLVCSGSPTAQGGALYLQYIFRTALLVDCTLVGSAPTAYDSGGCLFLSSASPEAMEDIQELDLRNVSFAGCKALNGGGLAADRGVSVRLEGCRFEGCTATETGGAVAMQGALTDVGSIFIGCNGARGGAIWGSEATVALTGSQLLENSAVMAGGAIFLEVNSFVALENCTATGNRAAFGTGGVLAVESSTATVTEGVYTSNQANLGGVLYGSRSVLTSRGARYAHNSASSNGGAWCLYEGTLNGQADDIEANEAVMGGALHISEGFLMLDGVRLAHNTALASGGALHAVSSQLQLQQCHLVANDASLGGAVGLEKSTALVAVASNFTKNSAGTGGAFFSTGEASRFDLDGCRFVRNEATLGAVATFSESGTATRCLFESNNASEGGSAFYLISSPGQLASGHVFRFRQSTFCGQAGRTEDSLSQPLRAALFLRGVRVEVEDTTFARNRAGAIFAREASEVSLGPGCAFSDNVALVNKMARPVNVWLSASGLTLAQPELMNDTAIPGGSLWVYPEAGSTLSTDSPALPPLLPLLEGTIMNRPASGCFDTPLLDVTVLLRDPATAAGFGARCYFVVVSGNGMGNCAVPDPRREATYRLIITNDGHRSVTVATFSTAENRLSLILGTVGGSVGTMVMLLLALGTNFLVRWIRLKRAAARELAEWKGYQLATVDFGGLKFVKKIGEGGAGQVFLADLNATPVAVKRLVRLQTAAELADFRLEVDMMRTLRHPFIVSLIGATFEAPQQIVTEYMARGSLDGLLASRSARLPLQLRLRMAYDMAREFAAPEVLREGRYLLASDVFSFGIVLWELTTRQVAWKGVPRNQVVIRVQQGDRLPAPSPSEFPPIFCELISRCGAQDPEARPTMQQIVERLGAEVEMNPYTADPSAQPKSARRPRRKAAPAGAADGADVLLEPLGLQAPLLEPGAEPLSGQENPRLNPEGMAAILKQLMIEIWVKNADLVPSSLMDHLAHFDDQPVIDSRKWDPPSRFKKGPGAPGGRTTGYGMFQTSRPLFEPVTTPVITLVAAVAASPCYISASGVDQLPCNSPNAPCRTTSYALDTAACSHVVLMTSIDIQTTIMIPSTLAEFTLAGSVPGTLIRCGGNVGAIAGGLPNNLAALTLANLTFEGCRGGGALSFQTNVTTGPAVAVLVDHCVFHQCASSCDGGALSVASTTPGLVNLTLVDSWFNGSSLSSGGSPCTGGSGHGGGAVRVTNPGRVTALRTVFTHNRAGSDGGALLVTSSGSSAAEVRLAGCRFEDNTLNDAASNVTGGAVSLQVPGGSLTVEGCVFQDNAITTTGAAQRALGGALHAPGLHVVTIQNSTFASNTATSTGGDGAGGAIYLGALQDSLRLVGCNLTGNTAAGLTTATAGALFVTGGADVLAEGCLLSHNTATGQGDTHSGSLCLDGAQRVNITRTEFTANQAQSTKASAFGGALRWHATVAGSSLRLDHVVAEGNQALACTGSGFNAQGGAIQVLTEAPSRPLIHLAACHFHQNEAQGEASLNAYGGALAVVSSDPAANLWGNVTIEGSQFRGNRLVGAIGGGGAVHLGRADQVLVRETTFDGNNVVNPAEWGSNWAPDEELVGFSGGAMMIGEAANVTMDAVQFGWNSVTASTLGTGGALSLATSTSATLRGCLFEDNDLAGGGRQVGGALAVFGKGDVTIEGTRFMSNSIDFGSPTCGGAVGTGRLPDVPTRVAVRDCWFEENLAKGSSANGGGLCLTRHQSVELTGLTFLANNVATDAFTTSGEFSGGGLDVKDVELLSLTRVSCDSNQVYSDQGAATGAGASLSANKMTTLVETTFVNNLVTASLLAAGGGLSVTHSINVTMVRSYLGANRLVCTGCTSQGGDLYLHQVSGALLIDSTLAEAAFSLDSAFELGGCLFYDWAFLQDLNLRNVTFAGCKAQQGGGVAAGSGVRVRLEGCRFEGCTATETGGAIATWGGVIDVGSTFTGCTAVTGGAIWGSKYTAITLNGSQLIGNSAVMAGGALFQAARSASVLENCTATGNRVDVGTGGVLAVESSIVRVTGGMYTSNQAKEGGVLYGSRSDLTSRGARYAHNVASSNGGAWCLYKGTLDGLADDFEANEAAMGGAVHSSESTLILDGTRLARNVALASGGALHAVSSEAQLSQCSFAANKASLGGAIALEKSKTLVATASNFTENSAGTGGALHSVSSQVQLQQCRLVANVASLGGGAVALVKSAALVAGASNFTGNSAGTGGAFFSTGNASRFDLDGCQFVQNQATLGAVAAFSKVCSLVPPSATKRSAGKFSLCVGSGTATGCLFESNSASEAGSAFHLVGDAGQPASTHVFRFRESTFRGQAGRTEASLSQPLRAALFLRGVRVEAENTTFTENRAGAIFAREASEVSLGPGCAFADNVALVNGLARPVNVWLSASGLTLAQPELMNDTAIPGGALWIYPEAGTSLPVDSPALPPLLPLLEGTLMNLTESRWFYTPLLTVTVLLKNPATAAGFGARCYFVVSSGQGMEEVEGPMAMSFTNSPAGLQGSCAVPDPRLEASYRLIITNDGHRNVTVATFATVANRVALIAGTVGGSVGTAVLFVLGLGCFFLLRWICRKQPAAARQPGGVAQQSVEMNPLQQLKSAGNPRGPVVTESLGLKAPLFDQRAAPQFVAC